MEQKITENAIRETKEFAESQEIEFTDTIKTLVQHGIDAYRGEIKSIDHIAETIRTFAIWVDTQNDETTIQEQFEEYISDLEEE